MATAAYYHWVSAGKPYTDCRPIAHVAANIRRHGYTVYTAGDSHHQLNDPPEDHTAFSATGWPVPSAFGVGHAMDIMPPTAAMVARGLPTLAQLAGQIYADRLAGHEGAGWLKYQNWEPSGTGGPCIQDSWEPNHRRANSTDRGHIHNSARSDMDRSTIADDYDPVQRWLDRQEETDMPTPAEIAAAVWGYKLAGTAEPATPSSPGHAARSAETTVTDMYKRQLSHHDEVMAAIHELNGSAAAGGLSAKAFADACRAAADDVDPPAPVA